MEKINNKISFLGEFVDKSMERDFLKHSMNSHAKVLSFVALVFGVIFILFLGTDIYDLENSLSISIIIITRILFFIISMAFFLYAKQIKNYLSLRYLLTTYEAIIAISYLAILSQYDSLRYLSVLGLMVVFLAIYLISNKLKHSLSISIILGILFFLYPAQKIEGLKEYDIYKIIVYQLILLIHCNINAVLTNSYRRKQFAANRELIALSVTDPLTGICNRAKFDQDIDDLVKLSNQDGNHLSIIFFDIDDFKKINDSYGHIVGDSVIKNIVATIKKLIRDIDVFARWGGEEFVILLPDTDIRQAGKIAERLRIHILKNFNDPEKNITCSFGVATLEEDDTAQSLLHKADNLLIQAKTSGKNRVVCQATGNA